MSECCVREMTIEEEIRELDIDESIKKRIIEKAKRIIDKNHKQDNYLHNCHCEIDGLKNAIVSQAKIIGTLEEQLNNRM